MSTPKEKCVLADIKNFYLNNDIPDPEYMKFHISTIPQEIIDKYNLLEIVNNHGFVYVKILKGMYVLKQAGIIAQKSLINHLAPFGYHPYHHTPGIWQYENRDTMFTLVVDDFANKYTSLKCQTFTQCITSKIYNIRRLGGKNLHRNHLKVGLYKTNC